MLTVVVCVVGPKKFVKYTSPSDTFNPSSLPGRGLFTAQAETYPKLDVAIRNVIVRKAHYYGYTPQEVGFER